jgi:hypothetical protein
VTAEGVTDWVEVFDNPETGFIAVISRAHSPTALKQSTLVIIRHLFIRNSDEDEIKKYTAILDEVIPDDIAAANFDDTLAEVATLLAVVRDERQQKANDHHALQKAEKGNERRGGEGRETPVVEQQANHTRKPKKLKSATVAKKPVGRPQIPVLAATSDWVKAAVARTITMARARPLFFALGLTAVMAVIVVTGIFQESNTQGRAATGWIRNYFTTNLKFRSLKLSSVEVSANSLITVRIIVSEDSDVNVIKSTSPMARLTLLEIICPPADSGVQEFLKQGWNIWIEIKGNDEKLTGGTCPYEDP